METTGRAARTNDREACLDPGAITPEDVVVFLDGEAAPPVVAHIRRCPRCTAEARDLARTAGQVRRALYRFDCPRPQTLGEYELDLLAPEERTDVAAHVLDCAHCAAELETLRAFLRAEPVAPVEPVGVVEHLRRVIATLLGPAPELAPVALRGAGESEARTYRVGDVAITIGPGPEARRGRISIMGLVVRENVEPETLTRSEVRLSAPDGAALTTAIDELGNFAFDDVAPGTYRLEVRLADQIVVVEEVRVGGT